VYELATQQQAEATKLFEGRRASTTRPSSAPSTRLRRTPAGSDVAVAAVKSALAAPTPPTNSFTKVAKQGDRDRRGEHERRRTAVGKKKAA